jgi:hypothetical protein
MQNLGATIGQGIKDFGEARQERKKIDAEIKATSAGIESAIKMGKDLGIDIGSYLSPIQAKINDPNTSPVEALALGRTAAQGISNAFTLGIGAQDRAIQQERQRSENAFKLANLEVAQQRANIYGQKAQAEASKLTKGTLSFFDPDTNQSEEMDVNYDPQGRPRVIGTGELIVDPVKVKYGEGGVEKPPETSQVGGISDSIAKASQLNINQPPSNGAFGFTTKTRDELGRSSIGSRQVSLDFNAAASKDAKGIEIIIPNDATPEERNAANRYVQLTQRFFADRGLNRPIRGVRTAKENGRGTPGRFHTEPFFVGDGEARKIMESDPDGYAQVLANAFNGVQGVTFIAPHKKNDPGASDGKFNERDFAKGSIIPALERLSKGDLSQQAMGAPEQQAEVARQIKQGAGMQMVQAGGGMPTEPSLAQQQPQLPARRQVVATRPVGGGQQQQKTVRIVSGEEAQRFGLKPEGTYELSFNPTGELAGTQTISQPPTETEKAKAEETRIAKEKAAASKNIAIKTISEFVDNKGEATDALKSAVGYGEAFATGVAEYAPFLGTQSGKTRSDQQRLNRLIEGSILEAASLLKPVSNTDLLMLIKNRPKTTDPEETWTTYLGEIRSILADPNNYLDSGTTTTGPSSQAESDASFIQGFSSGE